jgi:hypothetical protein
MECLDCGNCKTGSAAFYCLKENEFVLKENLPVKEKVRNGWKKGYPEYETQRRKNRKEVEV